MNGEPGVVFLSCGAVVQVTTLSIGTNVQAVYIIVNPDKLARWSAAEIE